MQYKIVLLLKGLIFDFIFKQQIFICLHSTEDNL